MTTTKVTATGHGWVAAFADFNITSSIDQDVSTVTLIFFTHENEHSFYHEPYLTWTCFELSVMGGRGMRHPPPPHHNFVVIAPMIKKFGTGIKHNVFYIILTEKFVTSLQLRNHDVITCVLADA